MKLIKTASGKSRIKLSKKEWTNIGKKAGWIKKAQSNATFTDIEQQIEQLAIDKLKNDCNIPNPTQMDIIGMIENLRMEQEFFQRTDPVPYYEQVMRDHTESIKKFKILKQDVNILKQELKNKINQLNQMNDKGNEKYKTLKNQVNILETQLKEKESNKRKLRNIIPGEYSALNM